jgi:hypothetical protein
MVRFLRIPFRVVHRGDNMTVALSDGR